MESSKGGLLPDDCQPSGHIPVTVLDDKEIRKNIAVFLRDLANKLENDEVSEKSQQAISEFFMKFLFIDEISKVEEDEMMKFLSLGWYVYTKIK